MSRHSLSRRPSLQGTGIGKDGLYVVITVVVSIHRISVLQWLIFLKAVGLQVVGDAGDGIGRVEEVHHSVAVAINSISSVGCGNKPRYPEGPGPRALDGEGVFRLFFANPEKFQQLYFGPFRAAILHKGHGKEAIKDGTVAGGRAEVCLYTEDCYDHLPIHTGGCLYPFQEVSVFPKHPLSSLEGALLQEAKAAAHVVEALSCAAEDLGMELNAIVGKELIETVRTETGGGELFYQDQQPWLVFGTYHCLCRRGERKNEENN